MNLTEMINATLARHAALQAEDPKHKIWFCSKSFDGVGRVHCDLQDVATGLHGVRPHWRKTWALNGQRIAAAKLAEIVGH
jgi:hypothetical protein